MVFHGVSALDFFRVLILLAGQQVTSPVKTAPLLSSKILYSGIWPVVKELHKLKSIYSKIE